MDNYSAYQLSECREKCLELHQNVVQKLSEDLASKSEMEMKSLSTDYETKIAELEKEIQFLNEELYDAKSQYLKQIEENKSLQVKLDNIAKPKGREEIEKELQVEYEKKLKCFKEEVYKECKGYFEARLVDEREKAQIEWTKEKMIEIQAFIDSTKQNLDEEFQNCLKKKQAALQQQLTKEKEKLQLEYQEKLNALAQHYEDEKEKISSTLSKTVQSKWKKEISEIQKSHEIEISSIKLENESKILSLESEIKNLRDSLSQKYEEENKLKLLNSDLMGQKEAWEKERTEYKNTEFAMKEKLKSAEELEKKLREKIKKYQRHVSVLEREHQEKISKLQSEISELTKSGFEKQNQMQEIERKYEQEIFKLTARFEKYNIPHRNSESQTEEELVPKRKISVMQNMFVKCLRKIAEEVENYLLESRKRGAERLKKILSHYHETLASKVLQDISKDTHSTVSNICIPQMYFRSTPIISSRKDIPSASSINQQFNTKIKMPSNSVFDIYSSGDRHFVHKEPISSTRNGLTNDVRNLVSTKPSSDSAIRIEDISFDFIPLKVADNVFSSNIFPDFTPPERGSQRDTNDIMKSYYPDKLSPAL